MRIHVMALGGLQPGSHGQCCPDRGLFIPDTLREGARSRSGSDVPLPSLCLTQNCCNWTSANPEAALPALSVPVEVHVLQPLAELFFIPHKPIPELVLPERPLAAAPGVKLTRRNLLHIVEY